MIAALVAVALVTGLSDYNRRAVDAGQRALIAASPAEERGLLVSGSGGRDAAEFATRDSAVRDAFATGLAGVPVRVAVARYGTGRELTGDLGQIPRPDDEPVFANLTTFDDLAGHAELTNGAWPTRGEPRPGEPARTGRRSTGTERRRTRPGAGPGHRTARRPGARRHLAAPRPDRRVLAAGPGVGAGSVGSGTSYGPFTLDPADFAATFRARCRRPGWPNRTSAESRPPTCPPYGKPSPRRPRRCPRRRNWAAPRRRRPRWNNSWTGSPAPTWWVDPRWPPAAAHPGARWVRVGAGRRTAARGPPSADRAPARPGAARRQLAGLAAREATLVVAPAAVLGPLIASEALRHIRPGGSGDLTTAGGNTTLVWAAAAATAAGCLVAMVLPTLRGAGTYVADMAARSRPNRAASVQRASVDLVLVALAVLAWCSSAGTPPRWPARAASSGSTRCWSPPRRSACWPVPCWRCGCSRRSPGSPSDSSTVAPGPPPCSACGRPVGVHTPARCCCSPSPSAVAPWPGP
ncbi:hypothetical protein NKG94_23675 [Micromonospora sp. M12]